MSEVSTDLHWLITVLLIICLIPTALTWLTGYFRHRDLEAGVDNKNPRLQYLQLEGIGARSHAAQLNAWEALILYLASLWVASAVGLPWAELTTAATVFLVCRILHTVFYLMNLDILRSLSHVGALCSVLSIFYKALV